MGIVERVERGKGDGEREGERGGEKVKNQKFEPKHS